VSQNPICVVFVCTGNSCRSQMAEGLARTLGGGRVQSSSAGTHPRPVHPLAVRVMAEIGIDIGEQHSKTMDALAGKRFDFAITVCDRARQQCPAIPGVPQQIHWGFDDPAEVVGSEEDRLRAFRRVRDELRQRIRLFLLANGLTGGERDSA
jgi:thioredoxin type arsenate reductase